MARKFFLFALLVLTYSANAQQTGEWIPDNANRAHPRGIMLSTEREEIIRFIELNEHLQLYQNVFSAAQSSIPAGNSTSNERRERATLAKNAAFCLFIGKAVEGKTLRDVTEQEKQSLTEKSLRILSELNTDIPELSITTPSAYEDWQWRSKELIDALCAYDLLLGMGLQNPTMDTARVRLLLFTSSLYTQSTKSILGFTFFSTVKNNHALMTAGALGFASIILSEHSSTDKAQYPSLWFQTAITAIDDILWKAENSQSNSDGTAGYSEGPYYLRYAMLNLLPFFKSLSHYLPDTVFNYGSSSIPHPYYDNRVLNIMKWATGLLQPDGNFPAIGDTYVNMGFPETALLSNPALVYPFAPEEMSKQLLTTVDMRANFLAAHTKPALLQKSGLSIWEEAGSAVYRTFGEHSSWYLHAIAKNGKARTSGAGHSQADATSFTLWNNGTTMALDAGYIQYSRRREVGNAQNHNMILVDGIGPPIGQPLNAGSADAFFTNSFSIPHISYTEIETTYNDTHINRSIISIADTFVLIADKAQSSAPKQFTFQLHGNGKIGGTEQTGLADIKTINAGIEGTWQRDSARLDALIITTGEQGSTADSAAHEESYNNAGTHTVARVRTSKQTSAAFVCLLSPRRRYASYLRAAYSDRMNDTVSALGYEYGNDQYIIASIQSDTALHHVRAITPAENGFDALTDGSLTAIWQGIDFWDYAIIIKDGTLFRDDYTQYDILSANKRVTMAISAMPNGFRGYVSKPCIVKHRLLDLIPHFEEDSLHISSVEGDIISWGQDSIHFRSGGEFSIAVRTKTTAVREFSEHSQSPYPQPAKEIVIIPVHEPKNIIDININDIYGNSYTLPYTHSESSVSFHIENLSNGIYYITVRTPNKTKTFLIQKVQ